MTNVAKAGAIALFLSCCSALADLGGNLQPSVQTGHSEPVISSAISPNQQLLATAGIDTKIAIFDLKSGFQIHSLSGHFSMIHDLAFSHDSKFLASSSSDGSVRFWRVETGEQIEIIEAFESEPRRFFMDVEFSPDGRFFLTSVRIDNGPDAKEYVYVYQLAYQGSALSIDRPFKVYSSGTASDSGYTTLNASFSKTGSELIVRKPGTFNIYSTDSWALVEQHPSTPSSAARPQVNDRYVFADGTLIDRPDRQVIATLSREASNDFDPQSNVLSSRQDDQLLILEAPFDSVTRKLSTSDYNYVAYHPSVNAVLLGADTGAMVLKDLETESEAFNFNSQVGFNQSADLHVDGRYLAVSITSRQKNYVAIWDLLSGKIVRRIAAPGAGWKVEHVLWEPGTDNLLLLAGDGEGPFSEDGGVFRVKDAVQQPESSLLNSLKAHPRSYAQVGNLLAVGNYNGQFKVIDLSSNETLGDWHISEFTINGIDFVNENRLLALDMTGRVFDIDLNTGKLNTEWRSGVSFGSMLKYLPNLEQVVVGSAFEAGEVGAVHDITHGELIRPLTISRFEDFMPNVADIALTSDGQRLLMSIGDGSIWELDTKDWRQTRTLRGHDDNPRSLRIVDQGKKLISASWDGKTMLWDLSSGDGIASFITLNDDNSIAIRPDLTYLATPGASSGLGFRIGNRVYAFDQFDAQYNRPDKVLASLGQAPQSLINAYASAARKRKSYLGLSGPARTASSSPLPEIALQPLVSSVTQTQTIELEAIIRPYDHALETIDVWINDIPIAYSAAKVETVPEGLRYTIPLTLSAGRNDIKAAARTIDGTRGLADNLVITHTSVKPRKPDLYLVAVGSSQYQSQAFNLDYAAKDARDVVELFKKTNGKTYQNIKPLLLTDEQVTRENFLQVEEFIDSANVDDVIIVMMAGHGLLSEDLEYYFATFDVDFLAPMNRGLSMNDITDLLSNSKARQRVVILDTCHAGEVDKQATQISQTPSGVVNRSFRGLSVVKTDDSLYDGVSPFQLMLDAFADLRSDRGITILSSSAGSEYAIESDNLQNGVFTAQLLRAFDDPAADGDLDGALRLSELKDYAEKRVEQATGGSQTVNFRVWNQHQDVVLTLQN